MTTTITSLNQLLAANYAYVQRPTGANSNPPSNNFGRELADGLKPGTTVTEQTQYTVDVRGRLQRTGSKVTIGDQQQADSQLIYLPYSPPAVPTSLSALARPKPQLTPSQEALLFDADSIQGGINGQPRRFVDDDGAKDENGESVEVEILSPELANREVRSLRTQQQSSVSNLYARNNDIVYNVEPVIAFAA